jgi:cysteine-rich repeat protein
VANRCDPHFCGPDACGSAIVGGEPPYPIEECDDGNLINGDGCDNNCTVTACQNGVVTGSEYCDAAAGRCVGGSYAGLWCVENAECTGGFCTYGPSGSCKSDCTACGPSACCAFSPSPCMPDYWYGQSCAFGEFACDDPGCTSSGTCCVYGDVCTAFNPSLCDEYEGTLVDCSQCAP